MVEVKFKFFLLTAVLISLLAVGTASAAITPTVSILDSEAKAGESLSYKLNFYNDGSLAEEISLNILFGEPTFSETSFRVNSGETKSIDLNILIDDGIARAFGTQEGKTTYQQVLLFDKDGKKMEYLVLIPTKIYSDIAAPSKYSMITVKDIKTNPEKIDPRGSFDLAFSLSNPSNLTPLASISLITDKGSIDFPALKVLKGDAGYLIQGVNLLDKTIAGPYDVVFRMTIQDAISDTKIALNVVAYGDCIVEEEVDSGILGKSYSAIVKNEGTKSEKCFVSVPVYGIEKRLISGATEGFVLNKESINWVIELSPGQSYNVSYTTTYIPIILIPVIILIAVYAYWYLTRKIVAVKELIDYKRYPDFMDLKLQIRIRNVSSMDVHDVSIYEILPAFVKEVKDFGTAVGKITKRKNDRVIKWELDTIKAKEERVFSYRLKTRVVVLGRMNFLPTVIEHRGPRNKRIEVSSNILSVEVQ